MTTATIQSVLFLKPGGDSVPDVELSRGEPTSKKYADTQDVIYEGLMTYTDAEGTYPVNILNADFPKDSAGNISVTITLNDVNDGSDGSSATFTGIATKSDGTPLDDVTQTPNPVPAGTTVLTLTFKEPETPGTTTAYTQMVFPTSIGYIDPEEDTERDPN